MRSRRLSAADVKHAHFSSLNLNVNYGLWLYSVVVVGLVSLRIVGAAVIQQQQ
jgi:hypothetical protein